MYINTTNNRNALQNKTFDPFSIDNKFSPEAVKLKNIFEDYAEYINDKKALHDIFAKIKSFSYINSGYGVDNGWQFNRHGLIINGVFFEYRTGTGIKCNDYMKILFDAVFCLIDESNIAINYSEDDFLTEFGYCDTVKNYKKGIAAFATMKDNAEKILEIFGRETVENIYNIIEL